MRNIWKIFTTDIRRISNNVVAVVIIMGLSILPALYAWFNIFSNWDPYEPAATSQLKVAVASDDAGAEIMGLSLNVGDSVLEALGANTTIGWVFPETTEEALEGVKNSDYYAALVIPETFTQEMLGFIDGEVDHPTITTMKMRKERHCPKDYRKSEKCRAGAGECHICQHCGRSCHESRKCTVHGECKRTGQCDRFSGFRTGTVAGLCGNAAVFPEYYEFCGDDHGH